MKLKYRYLFRTLAGPVEAPVEELEAGPFTPLEASEFAQTETVRRTMRTGATWVCDYAPIADVSRHSRVRLIVFALIFLLIGFVGARFALGRLQ